jgi:hypothetical protein
MGLKRNRKGPWTVVFNYWNGSHVGVIYILLRKIIAASDFYTICGPSEGTCYHVVHRVSHCYRHWRAGSLSKSDVNFPQKFLNNHPMTGKYNFIALYPILVIFLLLLY